MRQELQPAIEALQKRADYLSERYLTNGGQRFYQEYSDVAVLMGQIKQYVIEHERNYGDL